MKWELKRFFSKNDYLIQTDAVKNYLIPSGNSKEDLEWLVYAEKADILNVALFLQAVGAAKRLGWEKISVIPSRLYHCARTGLDLFGMRAELSS